MSEHTQKRHEIGDWHLGDAQKCELLPLYDVEAARHEVGSA